MSQDNTKVPFLDLKRIHEPIRQEIDSAIRNVIDSNGFILGETVHVFEKNFADFCGTEHAIGVGNGSDALELSLRAYGIGRGDEVITPVNSFHATAAAIANVGARPVFVDIMEDYNINVDNIESKITDRTKVILPVHLYGRPAEMDTIGKIAKTNGLRIIEDACQAHGAKYKGQRTGSMGDAAAFSFYPGKNLGAFGDGGIITTDDSEFADTVRMIRNQGEAEKYNHKVVGKNSRLDAMQAAILDVKLKYLDGWNSSRRDSAKSLTDGLEGVVSIPPESSDSYHVYHLYVIQVKDKEERKALGLYMNENGVGSGLHYPTPLHLQEAFSSLGYGGGDFPVAEKSSERILSLPVFPGMKKSEIVKVVDTVKKFYDKMG